MNKITEEPKNNYQKRKKTTQASGSCTQCAFKDTETCWLAKTWYTCHNGRLKYSANKKQGKKYEL